MQRIPEPELMDDAAQAEAYAEADFSGSDLALLERLGELFPEGLGSDLVDLGCGPGNICLRLAERYPQASVLGIDGAQAMLAIAAARLEQQPDLQARLRLHCGCLPEASLPERAFSAVVSNSLLHHLHDPQALWASVLQLAAPGCRVYIKDLRRPGSVAQAEALRERHMAGAPAVLQRDYFASLLAAFSPEEVEQQLAAAGLAEVLHVQPLEDRYLEVWGRLP